MPTSTVPQQNAWNYPGNQTQNLYTETTDQFGKTVFTTPGQGSAIHFTNISTPIGSNISIDGATGVVTLSGNITYRFDLYCETTAATQTASVQAGQAPAHVLLDITNYPTTAVIWPAYPMGVAGTVYYTPAVDSSVIYLAVNADAEPGGSQGASTWQYPDQIKGATLGVTAVSGYEV